MTRTKEHFIRRANAGDSEAWWYLGCIYDREGDREQALQCYRKGTALGEYRSVHYLALGYLFGDGVPCDRSRAEELFKEAADKGSAASACILGLIYCGDLTRESTKKAIEYFKAAADLGETSAMVYAALKIYLSEDYRMIGFADRDKGISLLERAAGRGSRMAMLLLYDECSGDVQERAARDYSALLFGSRGVQQGKKGGKYHE